MQSQLPNQALLPTAAAAAAIVVRSQLQSPAWAIPATAAAQTGAAQTAFENQLHRQSAFQALRPVTTQLLVLRNQPELLHPQLLALRQLLQELPPEGVESCWDYVAFPLMVLVDAVVPSRGGQAAARPEQGPAGGGGGGELVAAACRSDRVVEALLGALLALLECSSPPPPPSPLPGSSPGDHSTSSGSVGRSFQGELLQGREGRSPGPSSDHSVAVLQHLAPLLQLGREAASEEVHLALQRCVAAALAPLAAAAAAAGKEVYGGGGAAVLCSEEAVPLAGFLLHSCLEVSEREVLAGHKGSKALCAAALTSLWSLLAALPDPDVAAFFLPGVVSGLSKHLYAAGAAAATHGPSAPPGATATVQALACLRTIAVTVLSDKHTAAILGPIATVGVSGGAGGGQPSLPEIRSAEDALSALKRLSLSSTAVPAAAPAASAAATPAAAPAAVGAQCRRLCADRTPAWLQETSGRMNPLLGRALPHLCSHPRPAVRAELAATVTMLLDRCGAALVPAQPLLLRLLFTLAQDEWRQVAEPCQEWVARRAPPVVAAAPEAPPPPPVDAGSESAGNGVAAGDDGDGEGSGCGSRRTADLRALEDEFERFMQGLMSDSVLLEPPALELDEHEVLYGGSDEGAGGRDQGLPPPPPPEAAVAAEAPPPVTAPKLPQLPQAPPLPAGLPGLQHLIQESATSVHLLRAVRAGEAEAVVQARCLTTALLVAGPGRAAEWLLLRPAALSDLLGGLLCCFAFDRNAATLVLHLRGEAGSYAPVVTGSGSSVAVPPAATEAKEAAAGAAAAAAAALAGGAAAAAELPRMPLGLLHLASQRSYSALAAVARSLGRLARAADMQASAGPPSAAPRPGGGGSVLRRLVDELGAHLRRTVARGTATSTAATAGAAAAAAAAGSKRMSGVLAEEDACEELGEIRGGSGGGGRQGGLAVDASGGAGGLGPGSWQCDAAAVAAVMAEVVIGASNAWTPPLGAPSSPQNEATPPAAAAVAFPTVDPEYESVVLGLLQELMRSSIIKLPTHNEGNAAAAFGGGRPILCDDAVYPDLKALAVVRQRPLTAQALGENVMLLRGVLEAVGAAARAVGPRFGSQGRLLRVVLVPLLELLGDPAPPVAAAADTALLSICAHGGYGGSMNSLLAANGDYVVDAMCARLRDLQRHPRAPHLAAALLRRAGVAPQLLPLMAEPLQRTLHGLSPLARHWAPCYAHSYLAVLRELAAGAAAEAAAAGEESRLAVSEMNRLAAKVRDRRQAAEVGADDVPLTHEEVRQFFMKRSTAAGGASGRGCDDAAAAGAEEGEEWQRGQLLVLTTAQLEDGELRFRRLHAAATVAGAAADAATPLMLSTDLRAAVAAAEVLRGALAALAASTPGVEAEAAVLEEYGGAEARMRPVRPDTPKVLPVVAGAWGPLMGALRDARTPVVERAVAVVAELVAAAGGAFLARRFQQEAWPVLQRLLTHGSVHTPGLLSLGTDAARAAALPRRRLEVGGGLSATGSSSGRGGGIVVNRGEDAAWPLAPAAVTRIRLAALRCLEAVCRCRDATVAVRTLTWSIAQAALPLLGASHPPPLHEAAQAVLLAVAAIDPDGVWLLLYDTSYIMPPLLPAAVTGRPEQSWAQPQPQWQERQQRPSGAACDVSVCVMPPPPPGPNFPPLRTLLPLLPGVGGGRYGQVAAAQHHQQSQWPVTAGLAADCGPRAQSLLAAVAALPVPWHSTQVPGLDAGVLEP